MPVDRFNIRVYLLLLDQDKSRVLVSDEIINGEYYTKFPGGGLEYGEGILDCLHREAKEELGQEIEVIRQFYTTEVFQKSKFRPEDQIVCVYYLCRLPVDKAGAREAEFRVTEEKFDFVHYQDREESFRWQSIREMKTDDLSLPLDQMAYLIRWP